MKEITIDCAGLEDSRALHKALAEKLGFPDWYGNNLDALHDMLTSIAENTSLTLVNTECVSRGFRRVMRDAEAKNPHFIVTLL